MSPSLSVVADRSPQTETVAQRVRRLQSEARQLAKDHVGKVVSDLLLDMSAAQEIADGGEAYPSGVRQEFEALAREIERRLSVIEAISAKAL